MKVWVGLFVLRIMTQVPDLSQSISSYYYCCQPQIDMNSGPVSFAKSEKCKLITKAAVINIFFSTCVSNDYD